LALGGKAALFCLIINIDGLALVRVKQRTAYELIDVLAFLVGQLVSRLGSEFIESR